MPLTYRVHVGYSATGRARWRRFATLADAQAFCTRLFTNAGIVLTIVTSGKA